MSLAARLRRDSADLARVARGTAFVRGVADGSLPREAFAGYVAQDAHFLLAFARAYALALARSPGPAEVLALADLLTGVREELRLHEAYASAWDRVQWADPPAPATLAYTDFLLATAATAELGTVLAAMTPCMRLYADLGRELAAGGDPAGPYAEWVRTYADPGFEALAGTLERLLDGAVRDRSAAAAAYRRAMELEVAFFADAG